MSRTIAFSPFRKSGDTMYIMHRPQSRQHGVITLLVAMILFIAATLLVLYTSSTAVTEQRMSANEVRGKQAFEAAQAGIELGIRHANNVGTFDVQFTQADATWVAQNSFLRARFCSRASVPALQCADHQGGGFTAACTAPGVDDEGAWLVACGWSDDSAARRRIMTFVVKTNPLPGGVTNPLIAKGTVAMSGNPTVVNYYNNLTVWTGNNLASSSATGKTVIRRPSSAPNQLTSQQVVNQVGGGNQVCNESQAPDLICTTTSGVVGPDVIQGDGSLSILTDAQFFENFLGLSPNEYKSAMADSVVAGAEASAATLGAGGQVYWVDGDASIDFNIGSADNPVILVVDGDLDLSGSPTIFGVVFVKGDFTQGGGATIRGALLVSGTASGNGSLNVIYDPDAVNGVRRLGSFGSAPGSWRDF